MFGHQQNKQIAKLEREPSCSIVSQFAVLGDCTGSGRPICIGAPLSNRPGQLGPDHKDGCQGRLAHHYWALMTNITDIGATITCCICVSLVCFFIVILFDSPIPSTHQGHHHLHHSSLYLVKTREFELMNTEADVERDGVTTTSRKRCL